MIPKLNPEQATNGRVQAFLDALRKTGFSGDIAIDYPTRLINATDNSIYQLLPQAVLAPKTQDDIAQVMGLLGEDRFHDIALTPRGGGTGTNGQALNHTIILDCSKYMRRILSLDVKAREVTVEPGVILDQLNAELKPHGLFFPPTLSPSNRATLGGMVATDACGKGSRIYGKTSNYIQTLTLYLPDGEKWEVKRYDAEEVRALSAQTDRISTIVQNLADIAQTHSAQIDAKLPKMNREFSGYNLAGIYDEEGKLAPSNIIAGSEGTLGVVSQITFRLLPIPKHRQLVALCYRDFDTTLRAASHLLSFNPLAVETFDGIVFGLARKDAVWHRVAEFMPQGDVGGCNLVEFVGDDLAEVEASVAKLLADVGDAFHTSVVKTSEGISALWELRKRGVGLLGNMEGDKRPVPFAEDTAVPPEQLADYIAEYRALLDAEGVDYGMFGHVDVGCLHVRPALNLREAQDEARIRQISDKVVALVKRYGGLMWGEHGKGFRAEFSPEFIGDELYEVVRRIKSYFDRRNQLNPGKIATAAGTELPLYAIDNVPMRGQFDSQIQAQAIAQFAKSVECNGNGACFNYAADDAMCPSYKATGNRLYSPKGRAGLIREWLRQLSLSGYDIATGKGGKSAKTKDDFSLAVYDSMAECLACKACAGQCPIKVDIPDLRARFLQLYHTRYPRPLKDKLVRYVEEMAAISAKFPRFFTVLQCFFPAKLVGLTHLPTPSSPNLAKRLKKMEGAKLLDSGATPNSMPNPDAAAVVLVQDAFTSFYDAPVVHDIAKLLKKLGQRVLVAEFIPNGKARHVKGYLDDFKDVARKNDAYMREIQHFGLPMIGVDASVVLTYRQEYPQMLEETGDYTVHMLQEWLSQAIASGELDALKGKASGTAQLFSHCTEKTSLPSSPKQWQQIFKHFGMELEIIATGCCGMAGTYGHETKHAKTSRDLYEMSWKQPIEAASNAAVSGYSCRCQVERFSGARPKHPAQLLLEGLEAV